MRILVPWSLLAQPAFLLHRQIEAWKVQVAARDVGRLGLVVVLRV
jgi:hypothetical protein